METLTFPVLLSDDTASELETLRLEGYNILDLPSDLVDAVINSNNQ